MPNTALVIVDVQNDFLPPDGSLAVPNGREVLPVIERLLDPAWDWSIIVASQDYHPPKHISFASSHPPHPAFSQLPLVNAVGESYIQTLWPDHCLQGEPGCEIEAGLGQALEARGDVRVVRKGIHAKMEAYSAFQGTLLPDTYPPAPPVSQAEPEDGPLTETVPPKVGELASFLKEKCVEKAVIVGLATDFCVLQTALSSLSSGFETLLLAPAMRGISPEDEAKAFAAIQELGGVVLGKDGEQWERQLRDWI